METLSEPRDSLPSSMECLFKDLSTLGLRQIEVGGGVFPCFHPSHSLLLQRDPVCPCGFLCCFTTGGSDSHQDAGAGGGGGGEGA